jgi:hypothetical protein
MIVREYAKINGIDYQDAWHELYRQFGYRTNTNPTQCARNRGIKTIDFIENEGFIDLLESIAIDTMTE